MKNNEMMTKKRDQKTRETEKDMKQTMVREMKEKAKIRELKGYLIKQERNDVQRKG